MEHLGSRGLRRETLRWVAGLDRTPQDSLELVNREPLDLDQEESLEDLFLEGLNFYQEILWATHSTIIATQIPSTHQWRRPNPSLLQDQHQQEDQGRPRDRGGRLEGRGQPHRPPMTMTMTIMRTNTIQNSSRTPTK